MAFPEPLFDFDAFTGNISINLPAVYFVNNDEKTCFTVAIWCLCAITTSMLMGIIFCPVITVNAYIEAELGDTLTLHGISDTSNRVCLTMIGQGLLENGVTLTNVFKRTNQGHFTIVDVDTSQQRSMCWNTPRT
jgi:hypothetical protein